MGQSGSVKRGVLVILAAAALAACSGSGAGLTTSSLLPSSKPKVTDPAADRALQVAMTSARAARCGYNFDGQRLRSSYLAFEAAQEGGQAKLANLEKTYDTTLAEVARKIAPSDEYCTDEQTQRIKADLTRHLAGDYSSPQKKPEVAVGLFDWGGNANQPFDRQKAFCGSTNTGPGCF